MVENMDSYDEISEEILELDEEDEDYEYNLEELQHRLYCELREYACEAVPLQWLMREVHKRFADLLGEPVRGDWSDLDDIYNGMLSQPVRVRELVGLPPWDRRQGRPSRENEHRAE